MFMIKVIALVVSFMGILMEVNAMDKEWFQTWDRVEYQEWAIEIPEGYLLHIIRNEKDEYLVVQAKLIMGSKGLPGFEVIEQRIVSDKQAASDVLQLWKSQQLECSIHRVGKN